MLIVPFVTAFVPFVTAFVPYSSADPCETVTPHPISSPTTTFVDTSTIAAAKTPVSVSRGSHAEIELFALLAFLN